VFVHRLRGLWRHGRKKLYSAPSGGMTSALYVSSMKSSPFSPTARQAGRRRCGPPCLLAELVDAVLPLSRRACMASVAFHVTPRCGMTGRMLVLAADGRTPRRRCQRGASVLAGGLLADEHVSSAITIRIVQNLELQWGACLSSSVYAESWFASTPVDAILPYAASINTPACLST